MWIVEIALCERDVPFAFRTVDPGHPENAGFVGRASPMGQFPALEKEGKKGLGSNAIIDYRDGFGAAAPMVPVDRGKAIRVRRMDRAFDDYIMNPMQDVVANALRPEAAREDCGPRTARAALKGIFTARRAGSRRLMLR
ncbi:glutathione S-transferase N-terminal domain-containing protein [Sulfitobacter sp. LCG007]